MCRGWQGFITAGAGVRGTVNICALAAHVSLDGAWTRQRLPQGGTPHQIAYYPEAHLYAVVVSRLVRRCPPPCPANKAASSTAPCMSEESGWCVSLNPVFNVEFDKLVCNHDIGWNLPQHGRSVVRFNMWGNCWVLHAGALQGVAASGASGRAYRRRCLRNRGGRGQGPRLPYLRRGAATGLPLFIIPMPAP